MKTLRPLLIAVAPAVAVSLAGLFVARRFVPVEVLHSANDVIGNYLQTLGTVYAVLLAFVVFVVWTQFDAARGHVEEEANELCDLVRTALGFPQEFKHALCEKTHAYIAGVLDEEWPQMSSRDDFFGDAGKLNDLWRLIYSHHPTEGRDQALYSEFLARLNDLGDARNRRLSSARVRIPPALRVLIYFGAVMTIGSMYLFAIESATMHALSTAMLAGAISHILYIIEDLDNCFAGQWQVPRAPFLRAKELLEQHHS
jgi:hypothetical protein